MLIIIWWTANLINDIIWIWPCHVTKWRSHHVVPLSPNVHCKKILLV